MSVEKIRGLFSNDSRPILWLGAGASCQADPPLPTLWALVDALRRKEADNWQPPASDDPYAWIDDFVQNLGEGELHRFLEQEFRKQGRTPQPGPLHFHLAKLIAAGRFKAIIDTCYDLLLRRACEMIGAPHRFSQLDRGLHLAGEGLPLYLAIHGTWDDWTSAVLTGESYSLYERRHPLAIHELEVLLRQNRVLFVGCSLQDPRLLRWTSELPAEQRRLLHLWRAVIGPGEGATLQALKWTDGRSYAEVLKHIQRVELPDFVTLPRWFEALADEVVIAGARELALVIRPGPRWTVEALGERVEIDPPKLSLVELGELQALAARGLSCTRHGELDSESEALAAGIRTRARAIGERLFGVLPSKAAARLVELIGSAAMSEPASLALRVDGDPAEVDAVLLLPWELVCVRGEFPVGNGSLNLIREVVVPGAQPLPEDSTVPRIVAHVAAPETDEGSSQDLEAASYRIARALDPLRGYVRFTELGTLDDLVEAVRAIERPTILHFSGRGAPGELLFEDEDGGPAPIEIASVCDRLAAAASRLPAAFWLSCGHGASVGVASEGDVASNAASAREVSIAAQLHRRGIPQVLGYFGPIPDVLIARIDRALFRELVATERTVEAVRRARLSSKEVLDTPLGFVRYPFAWSMLALYHRGPDRDLVAGKLRQTKQLEDVLRPERIELAGAEGLPVLEHGFIGRRRLLARLRKLRKRGERALGLHGLGGLGKTTTMTRFALICSEDAGDVIALPIGDYVEQATRTTPFVWLLGLVRRVIGKHPRKPADWDARLEALDRAEDRPQALARLLLGLARGGVLYLDNLESMQASAASSERGVEWRDEALVGFFACLAREIEGDTTLLMTSRHLPAGECGCWESIPPCSKAEIYRMTAWKHPLQRLPEPLREQLTERIDGHPGTVDWINGLISLRKLPGAPPLDEDGDVEIMRAAYLDPALAGLGAKVEQRLALGSLIACLAPDELALLGECSAIQRPVPRAIIERLGSGDDRLAALGLLGRFAGEDAWALHSLVRESVGKQFAGRPAWTKSGRALLGRHREQCGMLERDLAGLQEALGHYLAAEQWEGAERVMIAISSTMHQAGLYRLRKEFLDGLREVDWPLAQRDTWLHHCGAAAQSMGSYREAEVHARGSIALAGEAGQSPADLAISHAGLANILLGQGKYGEAEAEYRQALAIEERLGLQARPDFGIALAGLASAQLRQGKLREAETNYREAIAKIEQGFGRHAHPEVALALHGLANTLAQLGELGEAEADYREAAAILRSLVGDEDHPSLATVLRGLGDVLDCQGKYADAIAAFEQSIVVKQRVFGTREHPHVASSLHGLANALSGSGEYDRAEAAYRESIAILERVHGSREHADIAAGLAGLANLAFHRGRAPEAEQLAREALAIKQRAYGQVDHPELAAVAHGLANALLAQGKYDEAEACYRANLELQVRIFATRRHADVASTLHGLASALLGQARFDEAESLLRESLAIKREIHATDVHAEVTMTMHTLATLLVHRGRVDEAHGLLHASIAAETQLFGSRRTPRTIPSLILLAELDVFARKQPSEALVWARDAWEAARDADLPFEQVQAGPGYVASLFGTGQVMAGSQVLPELSALLQRIDASHPVRVAVEAKLARMFAPAP
ncbi:tetratricopeptide repeat protein [Nannocystaceae bacterium ST9]